MPKTRPGKPTIVAAPVPADYSRREARGRAPRRGRVRQHGGAPEARRRSRTTLRRRPAQRLHAEDVGDARTFPSSRIPLQSARYKLKGSFSDSVWLQVAVYPDRKHKSVAADRVRPDAEAVSGRENAPLARRLVGARGVPGHPFSAGKRVRRARCDGRVQERALSQKWLFLPTERVRARSDRARGDRRARLVARASGAQALPVTLALIEP